MNSRFDRAERTFHEALGQDPALREAFIASACASDESLQQEVKRLLAAHEAAASYFDRPASTEIEKEIARYKPEDPGERIGPYKLLEKIGEGGFGVVWVAEQEHPVRRRVALKIIKLGMDTKEIVARFEQERQALAMMDHPNIAKVFDAGATPTGRPFFVMELVRGLKLTDYCDQQQLPTRQRIELFIHVCQAVQHAHQKGIIHRDLKPSNILVTINDGAAVPKVIDFGVAKATQGRLSDLTVYTQFEQMIGTPMYMSPEQAEMTSLDIDTRSDIYSLGVLLYELLTGRTPIAEDTLRRAGMDELKRVIREVDPVRPSLRIKELDGVELTTAAKRRQVEPGKLMTQLKGDVDWIVMKCLEKDRKRRYDTANGLAQDLRRHLNNELIAARPPTTGYLISKLVRRHKVGFAAGSAVAASIVIGFGVATWMFFKERDAKRRAVDAEKQESSLRIRAETNERRAATEATKSQQVAQFLQDMLKGVGPAKARGKDAGMLKQILDETEERLSKDLRDQPIVEAEIRSTLGQVYYDLGDYKKAGDLRRRVLDLYEQSGSLDYAREAARARIDLGVTLCERGMLSEAQPLVEAGFAGIKQLDSGPTIDLAHALRGLGLVSWFSGNYVRGEASLREEVSIFQKLGLQNDSKYASALSDLSWLVHARGGAEDSEKLDSEALRIWESLYGEKHPSIVQSLNNLALSKWYQGKLEEAQQMFRRANDLGNLVMGEAHTELASPRNNLALVLRDLGQYDEAERNSREALALVMKGRGAEQQHSVQVRKNLSSILRRKADLAKDRTAIIEAFKLNPTEVANTKCLASMSVRERLTSLAPDEASKELPWRYTRAAPALNWMAADFNDSAWQQSPAPAGVFTNYPRTPKTSIKGRSPLWLRRVISLAASPTKAVFISVGKYHDARIYINGVLAAPTADWSDVDFILRCSPQAQATLRPGRNSVAVLCEDADRSAPIEVRLLEGGEFSPDPVQFEFERLLNEEPERADLYAARAGYFASQGESQAAINSLTRSSELAAENWQYRASLALLLLVANDRLSYERDRSALLADFAKTERSEAAQETAFVALLVPAESAARDAADKLAAAAADQEYADAGLPARQLTKGLRDYRCDRFKEAIAACEKAKANAALKTLPGWTHERQRNLSVAADAIKAMAYQAVGQKTQAGETFLAAVEFADAEFPAMDGGDMGGDWKDLLAARTLLKEAQTVVSSNAGPR